MDFKKAMEYLPSEVGSARARIEAIRKSDSLIFPVFTDLHAKRADDDYVRFISAAIKIITEEIPSDAVINLGDNFEVLGRKEHITNEALFAMGKQMFDTFSVSANCPMIYANGNHDGVGTDFFKPEFWNGMVKSRNHPDAVYADGGSYFYIDFKDSHTRLVILSLPSDSELEGEHPCPVWEFGKKQLDWLENVALDTEKDVILISHVPLCYKYVGDMQSMIGVWNGTRRAEAYIWSLCGVINDLDHASAIFDNFAKKGQGRLVAALSGHTHEDFYLLPKESFIDCGASNKNPLPCPQVVTAAACFSRKKDIKFGFSVDIAIWTSSESELTLVRLGDGEDRRVKM